MRAQQLDQVKEMAGEDIIADVCVRHANHSNLRPRLTHAHKFSLPNDTSTKIQTALNEHESSVRRAS